MISLRHPLLMHPSLKGALLYNLTTWGVGFLLAVILLYTVTFQALLDHELDTVASHSESYLSLEFSEHLEYWDLNDIQHEMNAIIRKAHVAGLAIIGANNHIIAHAFNESGLSPADASADTEKLQQAVHQLGFLHWYDISLPEHKKHIALILDERPTARAVHRSLLSYTAIICLLFIIALVILQYTLKQRLLRPVSEMNTMPVLSRAVLPPQLASEVAELLSRIQLETQKRESAEEINALLSSAVEQAGEAVCVFDRAGIIHYVNAIFERTTGYPREEMLGKNLATLKGDGDARSLYLEMWEQVHKGSVWSGHISVKGKDAALLEMAASVAPVDGKQGRINNFVAVLRDITDENAMRARLEHVQRLESLGVLAGGIAHDFNNLLTAIMGNASMAERKMELTSPAFDHLERIRASSQKAADLCQQMLAYSGRGQFVIKPINLSELVDHMGKLLKVSIGQHVTLRYQLSGDLPAIQADVVQLQQVVMNLITNANEAIVKKSGSISLSTGVVETDSAYFARAVVGYDSPPGRYVYLEVTDTGCGMDEATQKRIFDPFFTTKFTGRGLGMSAVLGIVRGHQGALIIDSEPGRGTSLRVLFPSVSERAVPLDEKKKAAEPDWQADGTVLVVDDEEVIREVLTVMLEEMGFAVLTAADGAEGVDIYEQHKDDIVAVLLDMTMPKMNGEECFRQLKRINPDVKVLLSSGYSELDATRRFSGKGLAGFIQKPYSPDALAKKMRHLNK